MSENRSTSSTAGWLFVAVFCFSALFGRGGFSSVDEGFIFRTTESLTLRQTWEIEELSGRNVSRFSLLPSLWSAPFFAIGHALAPEGADRETWTLYLTQWGSCVATALTVVLLSVWLGQLGCGPAVRVFCPLLYAMGTIALTYSSSLFPQVTATPLLLLACWATWRVRWLTALIAFALAVWVRSDQAILWPALALACWQSGAKERGKTVLGLLAGAMLGVAATTFVNWLRGDPLLSGGYDQEGFTTPLAIGLGGLLFSFGKGLAWHAPLALLGLLGSPWSAARRPDPGRLILYVVVTQLIVIGKWWAWHGAWSWGPRLLLPILPLCMIPVALWLDRWREHAALSRRVFALIAGASVAVNVWAATQPQVEFMQAIRMLPTSENENIFVPHTGPFGVESQSLSPWLWRAPPSPLRTGLIVALSLAAILGLAVLLRQALKGWRPHRADVVAAIGFGAAACVLALPDLLDTLNHWAAHFAVASQYRQMAPIENGWRGRLVTPLRGLYIFFADPSHPMSVRLGGIDSRSATATEIFQDSSVFIVELAAGEYPIEIRGFDTEPGVLRWTIPGGGLYKQRVPVDYLVSSKPSPWQQLRIRWRHFSWLLWIPLAIAFFRWLIQSDRPPPSPAVSQTRPGGAMSG